MHILRSLSAFRRTMVAALVWVLAVVAFVTVPQAASGQEAIEPGLGSAIAQGVKVDPRTGRLSFGITYGLALAGHQNNVAVAESRSADLGVIGTTLAGEGCDGGDPTYPKEDQPQPLVVRSTEEDSAEGRRDSENGVTREAAASDLPLAHAVALTSGGGEPGMIEIGGTRSESLSGIVDGVRTAIARTDVSSISLGGGVVVLRGLHWEARYDTAPAEAAIGSFTIEGIEVGGQSLPIPEDNPLAPLAEANAALAPLGLVIEPPTVRTAEGIQFVDPMRIGIVPSDTREGVLGPVFSALAPFRESVFDALIEADCSNASYITVLDVVLNSFTGAGSLALELGGVQATSDDLQRSSFLSPLPPARPAQPAAPRPPVVRSADTAPAPAPSSPVTSAAPAPTPAPAPTAAPQPAADEPLESAAPIATAELVGSRGGPLAVLGGVGLALLAALAEADRRKMRRAQRTVSMEVPA